MPLRQIRFTIGDTPPPRLDKALARDVPEDAHLSRTRLARLLSEGAVRVDGVVVQDAKARAVAGAGVEITVEEAQDSHILPQDIPLDVVSEDDDLIVINKPAGMVVHPAPGSPDGTLVNALLAHCGDALSGVGGLKRPGIVHRIDKDTSGLLVVAKTDLAHQSLAAQFEAHTVERYYRALVYGVPDASDPRLRGIRGASFEPGNILKLTTRLARHKTAGRIAKERPEGNTEIRGELVAGLEGELDGQPATHVFAGKPAAGSGEWPAVKFRYFQEFTGTFALPEGFEPRKVFVTVDVNKPRKLDVREEFPWHREEQFSDVGE